MVTSSSNQMSINRGARFVEYVRFLYHILPRLGTAPRDLAASPSNDRRAQSIGVPVQRNFGIGALEPH